MKRVPRPRRSVSHIITTHSLVVFALVALGTYTITHHGPGVVSMIASSASSIAGAPATLYLTPYGDTTVPVGDTVDIDLNIENSKSINAVGATITFPKDVVQIVGINKKKSMLDLWTEDTVIKEELGEVHFSGGTTKPGGHTGVGTILTLTIKARQAGSAKIELKDIEVFASDGLGKSVDTEARTLSYTIVSPTAAGGSASTSAPPLPNPDLNADGRVGVADISILAVKLLATYDTRYDLNADGHVNLGDLSVLFSKI